MLAVLPVFILFSPVLFYLKEVINVLEKAKISPEHSYNFFNIQDQHGEKSISDIHWFQVAFLNKRRPNHLLLYSSLLNLILKLQSWISSSESDRI